MQLYFPSLQAIEQHTRQLDSIPCPHCQQIHHLVSHGFIRKKQAGADPQAVGKRVFCSNRYHHTGCGRTLQLYLDSALRYFHYAGQQVVAFVLSLMAGLTIQGAYFQATGTATPRHAYRWLDRLVAQLSTYRSTLRYAPPQDFSSFLPAHSSPRVTLLISTFQGLLQRFGQPLCSLYQRQWQQAFL